MKIGTIIQNEEDFFTVVAYRKTEKGNVALLVRADALCPYLTVRDLTRHKDGTYHWYFGHYTTDFEEAAKDYSERKSTLT